ncbi:MAG: polyprenyl synthetase family protein [bacterium]|nr:polyprenyl synthetase family protein [Gemmatimonadota bacterium]
MDYLELKEYLGAEMLCVDKALDQAITFIESELESDIGDAIRHGVMSDGKRLRPILCTTAYRECGGQAEKTVYDLSASLEMIHAYSLMHDDLPCMDDAELRRGQATTHSVFGEDVTIRAAAALIPAAARQALQSARKLECGASGAAVVVQELLEAAGAGGMVGGQWLDLLGEGQTLSPKELDELHGRKTGALLTASLVMGALAAAAETETVSALASYGHSIGLAFQITDDVLDATQSAELLGKNPSDVDLDKSTYVGLYGLDQAKEHARERIADALGALESIDIDAPVLTVLARYVIERER